MGDRHAPGARPSPFKVCCIQSHDEAEAAIAAGAAAIGLVAAMPSGPGPISDALIGSIAAAMRGRVRTVLLSSRTDPAGLISHVRETGCDTLQIVDHVSADVRAVVRAGVPDVAIWQVLHVEGAGALDLLADLTTHADALLLDSGAPGGAAPVLGGTGRVHDWSVSARVVAASPIPVWLAGGLGPANAAEAVRAVRPFGLDVCSGLRRNGALQTDLLAAFAAALSETSDVQAI